MTEYGLKTGRTGPLTNTELRATPVPVSGIVTAIATDPIPVALDQETTREANLSLIDVAEAILQELRITNLHLSLMTGETIREEDAC
jgi:hypothetical protein